MNLGTKVRLALLTLALGLAGSLIVLGTLKSQHEAQELQRELTTVDLESFGIADQFRQSLREVNGALQHYRLVQDEGAWEEFLTNSYKLGSWISRQAPRLTTQKEKSVLQQVHSAYSDYLRTAQSLHDRLLSAREQPPAVGGSHELWAQSRNLFDLGEALSRAHYESRNRLVANANHTLTHLRAVVLELLGLLFVFGIALGVLVYRDMIAPLRRKLIESQSLVERNEKLASLGLLAAGVAHEIRTPLTAIKTAVFVQKKRVVPGSPEQVDMDLVEREISRLERIVTDFLQFARPAGPELTTVTAELPLIEARRFFAPQLARSNIQVILEPPLPLRIKVDLHQIHQVLINLLKNAAESIGSDGTITLRARKDSAYLSDRETSVVILEVEDTGVGITPEVEKRLFDPFFTTKETGTGLGLAIAARIVQNHGGIVQYRPGPNRGAIFGIVLPEAAR